MANSKKSSTSKTARVMNLLSKNHEEPADAELNAASEQNAAAPQAVAPASAGSTAPVAAPAPSSAPHSTTPPIISSMQADSAISDQVQSALENALEDELGVAAETAQEAPSVIETESEPVLEPAPVSEPEPEVKPEPVMEAPAVHVPAEPSPVAQALVEAIEKEDQLIAPPTQFTVDRATIYVNVMEALVEEKANKYINLFGLCKCPRCVADVKALTLNRLEPKYVVMKKGDVIPRITLYEGQFAAAVTANLLTACKMVMEHPRHDR